MDLIKRYRDSDEPEPNSRVQRYERQSQIMSLGIWPADPSFKAVSNLTPLRALPATQHNSPPLFDDPDETRGFFPMRKNRC